MATIKKGIFGYIILKNFIVYSKKIVLL